MNKSGFAKGVWARKVSGRCRLFSLMAISVSLSGCASFSNDNRLDFPFGFPVVGSMSQTSYALAQLGPPPRRISVAVYDFPDLTGQRKPVTGNETSDLSTAVSQGSSAVLIEALKSTGNGAYFNVLDRTRDADQVRERSIITSAHTPPRAKSEKTDLTIAPLPPAEYILNGGVIAFERSILISDASLSIMGIGGQKTVTRNYISVTMRLVQADTAEVVRSVTAYRSIDTDAQGVSSISRVVGGLYPDSLLSKYPSPSDYVNGDLTATRSEMTQIATREAIEAALFELVTSCARMGIWERPAPNLVVAIAVPVEFKRDKKGPATSTSGKNLDNRAKQISQGAYTTRVNKVVQTGSALQSSGVDHTAHGWSDAQSSELLLSKGTTAQPLSASFVAAR